MDNKHTDTPWLVFHGSGRLIGTTKRVQAIAETFGPNAEEDAKFIVNSCNARNPLVRALELRLAWDEADGSNPIFVGLLEAAQEQEEYSPDEWVRRHLEWTARAAIAKAAGKETSDHDPE